jgi:hypothetical protein
VGTDEAAERRSPETAIARDGDRRLTIVGTRFAGETTPYRSFQVCESEIVAADKKGARMGVATVRIGDGQGRPLQDILVRRRRPATDSRSAA